MSLNGVNGKSLFYERMNAKDNRGGKAREENRDSFFGNLKEMLKEKEEEAPAGPEDGMKHQSSVQMEYYYGRAEARLAVRQDGKVSMGAAFEHAFGRIRYSEADMARAYVAEGYVLMAKVATEEHAVYVEQRNEDGSVVTHKVNPLEISKDSENPIEQIAAKAWEKTRDILNDGMVTELDPDAAKQEEDGENAENIETFKEMLSEFQEFVKKRLKDGPPKIQIGGSEFSEEEWERLLMKIDKDIDAYKEELRERVRKRNGQKPAAKETGGATEALGAKGEGEPGPALSEGTEKKGSVLPKEEGKEGPSVSENEAIEKPAAKRRRGAGDPDLFSGKRAPYSLLKDETGTITYRGVTFACDDKKQQICLGDMSNPEDVLTIPLSGGGCLKVNRNNLSDLAKAIDMFSAEDVGRILRAIAKDAKARGTVLELKKTSLSEAF